MSIESDFTIEAYGIVTPPPEPVEDGDFSRGSDSESPYNDEDGDD